MKIKNTFKSRLTIVLLLILALSLIGVFGIGIFKTVQSNNNLRQQIERYTEKIADESDRRTELEEQEKYVKTKEFIAEKAKGLGYVMPDEIVFMPEE